MQEDKLKSVKQYSDKHGMVKVNEYYLVFSKNFNVIDLISTHIGENTLIMYYNISTRSHIIYIVDYKALRSYEINTMTELVKEHTNDIFRFMNGDGRWIAIEMPILLVDVLATLINSSVKYRSVTATKTNDIRKMCETLRLINQGFRKRKLRKAERI